MSGQNVAVVRSIIETWNRDSSPLLGAYHDDAEWDFSGWGFEPHGSFRGAEAVEQMLGDVRDQWEEMRVEVDELFDGGDKVAFFGRFHARRRGGSGLEVSDAGCCVFTFRDGKIARFELVRDRETALALLDDEARRLPVR